MPGFIHSLKPSMVTGPEQVVNRFLYLLLPSFLLSPASLSQVGPEGAVSGPLGGLCLLCSIFPSSVGHLESPVSPRKTKSLPCPAQVPCPHLGPPHLVPRSSREHSWPCAGNKASPCSSGPECPGTGRSSVPDTLRNTCWADDQHSRSSLQWGRRVGTSQTPPPRHPREAAKRKGPWEEKSHTPASEEQGVGTMSLLDFKCLCHCGV